MKNSVLYLGLLAFFLIFVVSCAKTDDDTERPVIHYVRLGWLDTINVAKGDTIRLNVNGDDNIPDTLILKRYLNFEGHFSDNERLSTYMVYLDSIPENNGKREDSLYTFKVRKGSVSGKKEVIDIHRTIALPDSLSYTTKDDKGNTVTKKRGIREGAYKIKIELADQAGNVASPANGSENSEKIVYLFYRQTIIDNRSAWGY